MTLGQERSHRKFSYQGYEGEFYEQELSIENGNWILLIIITIKYLIV